MRIESLLPDAAPLRQPNPQDAPAFTKMLDDLGALFEKADRAEDSFAAGRGDLQSAIYERARADVAISVASAAASRTAQALQAIANMQV